MSERKQRTRRIAQEDIRRMMLKNIESLHEPVARLDTIKRLLLGLDTFASQMTNFFQEGFADEDCKDYDLVKSFSKPEEFVYGRIADRVNYDLDVIHRALSQRRIYQEPIGTNNEVRSRLEVADTLAIQALRLIQAKQGAQEKTTSVLTYYQRYLRTRMLPYTHVAPLAIPMSALQYDEDLTAIAHEVGHHAYRYLELYQRETLTDFFEQARTLHPLLNRWMEEIFADVYGAIVAGPLILWSFIEFAMQTPDSWFAKDDGRHPPPMLRPYIYVDVLRTLGNRWNIDIGDTDHWRTEWSQKVNDRGYNENTPLDSGESNPNVIVNSLTIGEAQKKIAELTAAVIDYLNPNPNDDPWVSASDWKTVSNLTDVITRVSIIKPSELDDTVVVQQGSFKHYPLVDPDSVEQVTTVKQILEINHNKVPVNDWIKILRFGDWVEVGPTGLTVHGM